MYINYKLYLFSIIYLKEIYYYLLNIMNFRESQAIQRIDGELDELNDYLAIFDLPKRDASY